MVPYYQVAGRAVNVTGGSGPGHGRAGLQNPNKVVAVYRFEDDPTRAENQLGDTASVPRFGPLGLFRAIRNRKIGFETASSFPEHPLRFGVQKPM
jgi:hypothetical protein